MKVFIEIDFTNLPFIMYYVIAIIGIYNASLA